MTPPASHTLALRVPWPVNALDPHRVEDPGAALFGEALFDGLYALENGSVVPALAEADPEPDGPVVRVRLRGSSHGTGSSVRHGGRDRGDRARPVERRSSPAARSRGRR